MLQVIIHFIFIFLEWMEPILTEEGKIAALKVTQEIQLRKRHPIIEKLSFVRIFLKRQATLWSIGNLPDGIRFQFSCIYFLVLDSLVFHFSRSNSVTHA